MSFDFEKIFTDALNAGITAARPGGKAVRTGYGKARKQTKKRFAPSPKGFSKSRSRRNPRDAFSRKREGAGVGGRSAFSHHQSDRAGRGQRLPELAFKRTWFSAGSRFEQGGEMATSNDLVKLANKHLNETYILGAFAPKNNANWKGPWDCAEFVSWLMFQTTGLLLGAPTITTTRRRPMPFQVRGRARAASQQPYILGQGKGTAGAVLVRKPAPGGIGHVAISQVTEQRSKPIPPRRVSPINWSTAGAGIWRCSSR